jgi:hypothetical protein
MVAGFIAGDIYGVAKAVDIFPIKITGTGARVAIATSFTLIHGIFMAMAMSNGNTAVINISYKVPSSPIMDLMTKLVRLFSAFLAVPCSLFIGRVIWMSTQAMESKMHIVISANNGVADSNGVLRAVNACEQLADGTRLLVGRPDLPIIVVGATDSQDKQPQWSNFGPCVDLFG